VEHEHHYTQARSLYPPIPTTAVWLAFCPGPPVHQRAGETDTPQWRVWEVCLMLCSVNGMGRGVA